MRSINYATAAVAAMVAFAVPASATVYPYGFNLSDLNTATVSQTVAGGGQISVTASAWNANYDSGTGKYKITSASLGLWDHGLGVTSAYDFNDSNGNPGGYNTHQIDNQGVSQNSMSFDFVQLTFTKAVTLASLTRTAFPAPNAALNNYTYDDDLSWGKGTGVAANQMVVALSDLFPNSGYGTSGVGAGSGGSNALCPYDSNAGTCTDSYSMMIDSTLATTTTASTTWYVAASILPNYGGDGNPDAFKLSSVNVFYNNGQAAAAVPEPSNWAMMIAGFGVIGGAMRRRRAADTTRAAIA